MKAVLVGPVHPYRGGIANYTTMLARALAKRCSQLHVISYRRQYPRWMYPGKTDRDPSQVPLRFEAEYLLDPFYPWTWWKTARKIAGYKPDVVIFQWWTTFWAPAYAVTVFLLRRYGTKVLFLIHNVMPHEPLPWDRLLVRFALQQGRLFLVQTGREKERLLSVLPQSHPIVTPHPVYNMFSAERIPIAVAKQRLGLPADEPVALFFGLVRPYKGLQFAIEAMAELRVQDRKVHLLVAGELWKGDLVYTRLIEQLELSELVRIDDRYIPNEEVSLYFSAADVFLAPYTGGTQSGAVKMALGFDLPVVISRAIASDELVDDKLHRLYWVAPKDSAGLAGAIKQCLEDNRASVPIRVTEATIASWETLVDAIEAAVIV